ncbi:AAA family ATPase SEC18 [Ascoidea rubescens DSM 1968]|uniref:Vesicular-fusion protein SEC18 n=1 Tax=Ascoidea rubescens DSM 1968 TaxID=1344418 RepID=A0A1D2VKR9_9ASCO|nr:ATPase required for the release of Sec17p [Ascoidea rubescens DSM 1968]ODV62200.1 ATPase required for the release of Sec17p [Ascoidea rubescens DSM 1968]
MFSSGGGFGKPSQGRGGSSGLFSMGNSNYSAPPPPPTYQQQPLQNSSAYTVINCPNNMIALSNKVAISSRNGIPDNSFIIINNRFVYTTMFSEEIPPRTIGFNGTQRSFLNLSLNEPINVQAYRLRKEDRFYIGSMNLEITFRNRNKAVNTKFDQDELSTHFIRNFNEQMFQPTQALLMEFKGIIFEILIQSLQCFNLVDVEPSSGNESKDVNTKGILTTKTQINFFKGRDGLIQLKGSTTRPRADAIIRPDFKFEEMGIGGLDNEFTQIFRRAFASRIFPPGIVEKLGISHVKGMLLYGPPGTGKTLIARKIGNMLNANEPKIVNGPEILSKYVGSSEENIRNLFKDAETEYKSKGEESSLHIIIFDELDSVFKQRGSRGDGTGVADNVVNQLLAKMDGVDQLNNILVIGMTNRRDLIDNALLRPGRFEVQVEISLPDEPGRKQILLIHTKKMKNNNMLNPDIDFDELAKLTKNFSGAEIEGLVKSATSFQISKNIVGTKINKDVEKMQICRDDFLQALNEVKPAFGVNEEDLELCVRGGIIHYSSTIEQILRDGSRFVKQIAEDKNTTLLSVLMYGPDGSGKTALAGTIALRSKFPFIRLISPNEMIGMTENAKIGYIDNAFRDAYKSPLNILVVDDLESICDYVPIGPRFSNNVLQCLKSYLKRVPPKNKRLLILSTTSSYTVLRQMELIKCFTNKIPVPNLSNITELQAVMEKMNFLDEEKRQYIVNQVSNNLGTDKLNIGIKSVVSNVNTARFDDDPINELIDLMSEIQI